MMQRKTGRKKTAMTTLPMLQVMVQLTTNTFQTLFQLLKTTLLRLR